MADFSDITGREAVSISARMPRQLKEAVEAVAFAERRSMGLQLVVLIERGLRSPETKAATEAGTSIAAK